MAEFDPAAVSADLVEQIVRIFGDIGNRQLTLKQLPAAASTYKQVLAFLERAPGIDVGIRSKLEAIIYHNLGRVAGEQRQWAAAEGYYQQALAIDVEFNDRYAQASTYHNLGEVAEEQRQWAAAREYYLTALQIGVEHRDEYRIG
ncbi:MAG: tetratricopeptide repeat protein, partial [Anaerolineae bacterium]